MHSEQEKKYNTFFADVFTGLSDGLTIPFALAIGLSVACMSGTVVLAGVAAAVLGAIAMGLSGYYTGRKGLQHNDDVLHRERQLISEMELDSDTQERMVSEMEREEAEWKNLVAQYGADALKQESGRGRRAAFNISIAYLAGGCIPLLPYLFQENTAAARLSSSVISLACLFIFGYLGARYTGRSPWGVAIRQVLLAAFAALGCWGVIQLFR